MAKSDVRPRYLPREEGQRQERATFAIRSGVVGLAIVTVVVGLPLLWARIGGSGQVRRVVGPDAHDLLDLICELLEGLPVLVGLVATLSLGQLARGLYARYRPHHHVDVDMVSGVATFVRAGALVRKVPIAELGPLELTEGERTVSSGKDHRLAWFFVGRSRPFPELVVHDSENHLDARRALEAHAKAWNLPYTEIGGDTRTPEGLDVPLFEQLRDDAAARKVRPPAPGSELAVTWTGDGYAITTRHRPSLDIARLVPAVVVPAFIVWWFSGQGLLGVLRHGPGTLIEWIALAVLVAALAPATRLVVRFLLRRSKPPSIVVTSSEVRFGGKAVPLARIEEIEGGLYSPPVFVSDEKILEVAGDFCKESEYLWLYHEVRRLVVGMGLGEPPGLPPSA